MFAARFLPSRRARKTRGVEDMDLAAPVQMHNPVPNADAAVFGDIQREMAEYRRARRQGRKHVPCKGVHAFMPMHLVRRKFQSFLKDVVEQSHFRVVSSVRSLFAPETIVLVKWLSPMMDTSSLPLPMILPNQAADDGQFLPCDISADGVNFIA